MGSKKKSARGKQKQEFFAQLGNSSTDSWGSHAGRLAADSLFEKENLRRKQDREKHEAALRQKSCTSKNRYACKSDAEAAIRSCADYTSTKLHCYRCEYCKGWHLTSKPL